MPFGMIHAAFATALFSPLANSIPIEDYVFKTSLEGTANPQFHTHILDNMNLTALRAWSPPTTSHIGKRADGENGFDTSMVVGRLKFCDMGSHSCGSGGSAALVGPRHILTARHASVPDGERGVFYPGYDHGLSSGGYAFVEHTYTIDMEVGPCQTKHDFAVMVLSKRLGDDLGWFGVVLPDSDRFDQPIFSTRGYPVPEDYAEVPHDQTSISLPTSWTDELNEHRSQLECDATGPIISDSPCAHGQSGSPLWDDEKNVWGALSIGIGNDAGPYYTVSGWASGDALLSSVNQALEEYP